MGKKADRKYVRLEKALADEMAAFLFALGNQFVNVKNAQGGFDCFKYCLDLNVCHQPACYNLAVLKNLMGDYEGSCRLFREASRMRPADLMAKVSLAEMLRKVGRVGEVVPLLEEVLAKDPRNGPAMCSIAMMRYDQGRFAEALEWNQRAMREMPHDASLLLNKVLVEMMYGNWPAHWITYEACLSYSKNPKMQGLRQSDAWAGQEREGKVLLVIGDQGSGDSVSMSRYLREAKELGKFGKLVFLVQPELKELMSRVNGIDEAVGFGERQSVEHDDFAALLGIMRVLQISPQDCLRPPHLKTDPALDAVWRARTAAAWDGESRKVAFVWEGDPAHGNQMNRIVPLNELLRLTKVPRTQWFSFQVGRGEGQLEAVQQSGIEVVDFGGQFRSFDDTASALKQMDLLISCDTSVPHVAGCLGVPAWVLISKISEWRMLLDRTDSVWYEETRLFRQNEPKEWSPVIEAVEQELAAWA
jgi:tetratricopeptide (TPR) repeat protein